MPANLAKYLGRVFSGHHGLLLLGAVLLALAVGYLVRGNTRPELLQPTPAQLAELKQIHPEDANGMYACPMGCIPLRKQPGHCPVCGMELVLVAVPEADRDDRWPRVKLDPEAQTLADIRLAAVEKKFVTGQVRTFGQMVLSPEENPDINPRGLVARLFVYEADFAKLRHGQKVTIKADAYPGKTFQGTVIFVGVLNDEVTRTFTVGARVEDPNSKLMPGMLLRATIEITISGKGEIVDKGAPAKQAPLVVPATAPLITGERAVVYVAVPGQERTYEGREVALGPRVGDHYIVYGGLQPGEMVVVHGSFKIDSALQIQARPSMMNPRSKTPAASQ
jgi:hypothetical protein